MVFCSKIISLFEINGEELILCESYCIAGIENMMNDVWIDFLVMETMYKLEVSVLLSIMNMVF